MERFIKSFGFKPVRHTENMLEYRGFSDLDKQAVEATRLLNHFKIRFVSIEKDPRLKALIITFANG